MIGPIGLERTCTYEDALALKKLMTSVADVQVVEHSNDLFEFDKFPEDAKAFTEGQLGFEMDMSPKGDKQISINIGELRLTPHIGALMKLANFATIDDPSVNGPPEGAAVPNINDTMIISQAQERAAMLRPQGADDLETENRAKASQALKDNQTVVLVQPPTNEPQKAITIQKQPEAAVGEMQLFITIPNIVICSPRCPGLKSTLAVRTGVKMVMQQIPPRPIEDIRKEVQTSMLKPENQQELNKIGHINLSLVGFELFICDFKELAAEHDFRKVRKREIFMPLDLDVVMKQLLIMTPDQRTFYNKTVMEVILQQAVLKISLADLNTLQVTAGHMLGMMEDPDLKEDQEQLL